ncbi:MAG: hypothetical protein JWO56_1270 [Acidobacteria bacterium]|nr:hypothetical protein [Acidobacteriota bacterium]
MRRLLTLVVSLFVCASGFATNLLVNGGFESGTSGWTITGFGATNAFPNAHTGTWYAYLSAPDGSMGNNLSGHLDQGFTIPANASTATFSFWYSITTLEPGPAQNDVMAVELHHADGSLIGPMMSVSNVNATASPSTYGFGSYDLAAFKGQSLILRFNGTTNATNGTTFRVDDVAVNVTLPPDAQTAGASSVTPNSATISGSVHAHGLATSVHFEWGTNQQSPASTATQNIGSNDFAVTVGAGIGGLQPGTTYSYRVVATSSAGTTTSGWSTFTTPIPRNITVQSTGPQAGVAIGISSTDGESGGSTPFTHTYYQGTTLTLTAPNPSSVAVFRFWYANGAVYASTPQIQWPVTADATLTAVYNVARGDIDQDGSNDIFFENHSTGARAAWLMNGDATYRTTFNLQALPDTNWEIVASGDFDGDGSSDILLRNYSTGANAIWLMHGTTFLSIVNLPGIADTNFRFCGIGDFNLDGSFDILIRNGVTGLNALWLMNKTSLSSVFNLPSLPGPEFVFTGTRDFNNDGKQDIVIRNTSNGNNALWLMNGTAFSTIINLPALPDTNYEIGAVADYNLDGFRDLVWRNKVTGANAIWLMNGYTVNSTVNLPGITDTNLHMAGPR